jgi:hypothetical protein
MTRERKRNGEAAWNRHDQRRVRDAGDFAIGDLESQRRAPLSLIELAQDVHRLHRSFLDAAASRA